MLSREPDGRPAFDWMNHVWFLFIRVNTGDTNRQLKGINSTVLFWTWFKNSFPGWYQQEQEERFDFGNKVKNISGKIYEWDEKEQFYGNIFIIFWNLSDFT